MANNLRPTQYELAGVLDNKEQFMRSGHQILVMRSIKKTTPSWAKSDSKIQKILLRSFPKLKTDKNQALRAGKWARIIYLYFRMRQTRGQIAAEMETSYSNVNTSIRNIKRAARGVMTNGRGVMKGKPGRPRKRVPA